MIKETDSKTAWLEHFTSLNSAVEPSDFGVMRWKSHVGFMRAEPYHRIAQRLGIRELGIDANDRPTFFVEHRACPPGVGTARWSIKLIEEDAIGEFRDDYCFLYGFYKL